MNRILIDVKSYPVIITGPLPEIMPMKNTPAAEMTPTVNGFCTKNFEEMHKWKMWTF